jgi:hypothetical protein
MHTGIFFHIFEHFNKFQVDIYKVRKQQKKKATTTTTTTKS